MAAGFLTYLTYGRFQSHVAASADEKFRVGELNLKEN